MRVDTLSGLGFAALGGALTIAGWRLPEGLAGVPGPGFFPVLIGAVLFLLGLGLASAGRAGRAHAASQPNTRPTRQVFAIVLLLTLYVALWNIVPFIWRTPVLLVAIYRVLGEGWVRGMVIAAAATAILVGVFEGLLRVRL